MLERLFTSESELDAVVYMWVPSHVGITPNELADALADMAEEWGFAEPGACGSGWQLARFAGVKRSLRQAVHFYGQLMLQSQLLGSVAHSLLPNEQTAPNFSDASLARGLLGHLTRLCTRTLTSEAVPP